MQRAHLLPVQDHAQRAGGLHSWALRLPGGAHRRLYQRQGPTAGHRPLLKGWVGVAPGFLGYECVCLKVGGYSVERINGSIMGRDQQQAINRISKSAFVCCGRRRAAAGHRPPRKLGRRKLGRQRAGTETAGKDW